jgi:hypothetical protein
MTSQPSARRMTEMISLVTTPALDALEGRADLVSSVGRLRDVAVQVRTVEMSPYDRDAVVTVAEAVRGHVVEAAGAEDADAWLWVVSNELSEIVTGLFVDTEPEDEHEDSNTHPTVTVETNLSEMLEIDEQIADLVKGLWAIGITTVSSCQGSATRKAHVTFADIDGAEVFLTLVAGEEDEDSESLWSRITWDNEPDDWESWRKDRRWRYYPDLNNDEEGMFFASMHVTFPASDLAAATDRVGRRAG